MGKLAGAGVGDTRVIVVLNGIHCVLDSIGGIYSDEWACWEAGHR